MRNRCTITTIDLGSIHFSPVDSRGRSLLNASGVTTSGETSDSIGLGGTGIYNRRFNEVNAPSH